MPPRIILDTNILISALMYPASVSRRAVVAAFRDFQPIVSAQTWAELEGVSGRKKFARYFSESDRLEFLGYLAQSVLFLPATEDVRDCADAKDNKFLSLAVSQDCRVIVSGDLDLRRMHPFRNVAIVSAGEFLALMEDAG